MHCRVGRGRARPQGLTLSQTMGPREHLPTPYPYAHASIFRSPLAYASGALDPNPNCRAGNLTAVITNAVTG